MQYSGNLVRINGWLDGRCVVFVVVVVVGPLASDPVSRALKGNSSVFQPNVYEQVRKEQEARLLQIYLP